MRRATELLKGCTEYDEKAVFPALRSVMRGLEGVEKRSGDAPDLDLHLICTEVVEKTKDAAAELDAAEGGAEGDESDEDEG